jgi:hypothetical protein
MTARKNFQMRMSEGEREQLKLVAHHLGRTMAGTVRWLVDAAERQIWRDLLEPGSGDLASLFPSAPLHETIRRTPRDPGADGPDPEDGP